MIGKQGQVQEIRNRLDQAMGAAAELEAMIARQGKMHAYAAPWHVALQAAEQRIDTLTIELHRLINKS